MKRHKGLTRKQRKSLLQLLSGMLLVCIVLAVVVYRTGNEGQAGVYTDGNTPITLGPNVVGGGEVLVLFPDAPEPVAETLLADAAEREDASPAETAARAEAAAADEAEAALMQMSEYGALADEAQEEEAATAVSPEEDTAEPEEPESEQTAEEYPAEEDAATAAAPEENKNETREQEDSEDAADAAPAYVAFDAAQIKNMIHTKSAGGSVDALVAALANCPDERARIWEEIFAYWNEVNQPGFITKYSTTSGEAVPLPSTLPTDDSLCFVVLGCGMNANGTMKPEMEVRVTAALRCAELYPNAYIVVTGGYTASGNRSVSEGGLMGEWLIAHGVDAGRVIVESASYQTCENAMKSVPILRESYPQVKQLVLVTSDYHIPLGALLLQAECLLDGNATVVANVGVAAPRYVTFSVREQAKQLEKLAFTGR